MPVLVFLESRQHRLRNKVNLIWLGICRVGTASKWAGEHELLDPN